MTLPGDIVVFERGWLSSNNVLLLGKGPSALVDSGYVSHASQTCDLVCSRLGGKTLDVLVNTHLHSDHCGGNAALQRQFPQLETLIPPGLAAHVRDWDPFALSYTPTGQRCESFTFNDVLIPGQALRLGDRTWRIHTAPGHDPHSVILHQQELGVLISADALWENGFGVVFPELEGVAAFDAVGQTLDLIEALQPKVVIPGHGSVFTDIRTALTNARRRLDQFLQNPRKHAIYAAKVLLKYKLLELQRVKIDEFAIWVTSTPYFKMVYEKYFSDENFPTWWQARIHELARTGSVLVSGDWLINQ